MLHGLKWFGNQNRVILKTFVSNRTPPAKKQSVQTAVSIATTHYPITKQSRVSTILYGPYGSPGTSSTGHDS